MYKFIVVYLFVCINALTVMAQSFEPRLYSNAPTDLQFLILGYGYSNGALALTPEVEFQDPNLQLHIGILAYARGFNFFGKSAKLDVVIPTIKMDGDALLNGAYIQKNASGLGDIKARISVNFFGAPALKLKNFAGYKQDTIIGMSLQITAPTGKYENEKPINIGTNIWAAKLGTGISKGYDDFTFELLSDVELYSTNNNFVGKRKKKDPIYSVQGHVIYTIKRGMWIALNSNYYWGGNSYVNGLSQDTDLRNSRLGAIFSMPIDKQNSIKVSISDGISTRAGTNFTTGMLSWQYRFGGEI